MYIYLSLFVHIVLLRFAVYLCAYVQVLMASSPSTGHMTNGNVRKRANGNGNNSGSMSGSEEGGVE